MKEINKTALTWISFFSFAFTGALVVVTGMIIGNVADYFNLSVSRMSNTFTFLNAGILISIFINSWLIEIIPLKKQIISGFILTIFAIIGIFLSKNIFLFSINIFILGLVSGITMSIGTFIITYLYSGSKRSSQLLITDSFFSMSGMLFPIITAYLLDKQVIWYWTYASIATIYLLIFVLTINTNFPSFRNIKNIHNTEEKWNFNIFLLSITALLYILGQLGFISWVPQYSTQILNIKIKETGSLVSGFWMSYMVGMWFFSIIIKFFNLNHMLMFLTGISTILMYFFIHSLNFLIQKYVIFSLGFFSSAIYTIIITLASLQSENSSPKLTNLILFSGTVGTLLTFIVTSPIVEKKGLYASLISSNILYGMVFLLSLLIYIFTKYKKIK